MVSTFNCFHYHPHPHRNPTHPCNFDLLPTAPLRDKKPQKTPLPYLKVTTPEYISRREERARIKRGHRSRRLLVRRWTKTPNGQRDGIWIDSIL